MRKKIECLVMSLGLLTLIFSFSTVPAHTSSVPANYWYDDFNDGDVSDWNIVTSGGGSMRPVIPGLFGDKEMYMKSHGTSSAYGESKGDSSPTAGSTVLNLMNYSSPYTVEVWFRLNTSNNHWFDVFSNRHLLSVIDYGTDFTIRERSGGSDVNNLVWTLNLNTWYIMKYWVDPPTNTFKIDVYQSGIGYVVSNQTHSFSGEWFSGITYSQTFRIGDDNSNSVDHGEAFWEDIKIWFDTAVPVLKAWASGTPLIDGNIWPGGFVYNPIRGYFEYIPPEWKDDAASINLTLTYRGKNHQASLYVKNDYINLYIAVKIKDVDYHDADKIYFNFDNDNDGVKEAGDNILWITGDDFFVDAFWGWIGPSTYADTSVVGGTSEGTGAAYNTTSKELHFETAFPLNTADDTHDFSLSIGDTVGFSLTFYDWNGTNFASSSWPSSSWDQMADIKIAGPSTPPPASNADLTIRKMEVTQAIQYLDNASHADNSLPLVRNKLTVVRAYVSIGPVANPISVTVYLYGFYGSRNLGGLFKYFSAPQVVNRGNVSHTANFWLPTAWLNYPSISFRAFVKADSSSQAETNYNNNWKPQSDLTLAKTVTPTIYIVPINTGSKDSPTLPPNSVFGEVQNYFRAVMPVASVNFVLLTWDKIGEYQSGPSSQLNSKLTQLGYSLTKYGFQYNLTKGGIDQIFGVTPNVGGSSGLSDPLWLKGQGIAASGFWLTGAHQEAIMAHEIDHNWGPGNTSRPELGLWGRHVAGCGALGPDTNWPYPNNTIQEYGFDTLLFMLMDKTTPDFMTYCVASGSSRSPGTLVVKRPQWISPYRWNYIFNKLDPPDGLSTSSESVIQQTGESMIISGWVSQNGTGFLDPIFRLPGAEETPLDSGTYSIVLQDVGGNTIFVKRFSLLFENSEGVTENPSFFTMLVPYISGTAHVLLKNNTQTLYAIHKSSSTPTVSVIYPNGGEVWGGMQTIQWMAMDSNGDTLTYRLQYSRDNGVSWIPLTLDLKTTTHQVNASLLRGSPSTRIRVVASDGFNNGYDVSNGPFTILSKLPTADILLPANGTSYTSDEVILFSGQGADVDDEVLPESSYTWTSDTQGYLGNGSQLTTILQSGTHQITLRVIDSEGNYATDSVTINVIPTVDIAVSGVKPSKTVVPVNGIMYIEVFVQNQGYSKENTTVSAYYNNNLIGSQSVLNLESGKVATLRFTWNTTGLAKGNYTLTATASIVPYEKDTLDNTQSYSPVAVAIVGDVNGPTSWPDGKVDIEDLSLEAEAYGSYPGHVKWDPNADTTGTIYLVPDNKTDIYDLFTVAKNYGDTDP